MTDILLWITILSLLTKFIIQMVIDNPTKKGLEMFLYMTANSLKVLLPIRETKNESLKKIGNMALVIFYVSFILLLLAIYLANRH